MPSSPDEFYMRLALAEAERAATMGEVPVGAVIVCNGQVLSTGCNRRETDKNALCHAELAAIDAACKKLGGWRLPKCDLYVTLEPCPMCAGAIVNARIQRVCFAAGDEKAGAFGTVLDLNAFPLNHKPQIERGVLEAESRKLLQSFFRNLRKRGGKRKQAEREGDFLPESPASSELSPPMQAEKAKGELQ